MHAHPSQRDRGLLRIQVLSGTGLSVVRKSTSKIGQRAANVKIKPNSFVVLQVFGPKGEARHTRLKEFHSAVFSGTTDPLYNIDVPVLLENVDRAADEISLHLEVFHRPSDGKKMEPVSLGKTTCTAKLSESLAGIHRTCPLAAKEVSNKEARGEISVSMVFISELTPFRQPLPTSSQENLQGPRSPARLTNVDLHLDYLEPGVYNFDYLPLSDINYEVDSRPDGGSFVTSASLELIIEALFLPQVLPGSLKAIHDALESFMMCHTLYLSSHALACRIWERLEGPKDMATVTEEQRSNYAAVKPTIRSNASSLFEMWLTDSCWKGARDDEALALMSVMLKQSPFSSAIHSFKSDEIEKALNDASNSLKVVAKMKLPLDREFPLLDGSVSLSQCSAEDVAQQWSLLEHEYYCCIRPFELIGQRWTKHRDETPGVAAYTAWFNHTSALVQTDILHNSEVATQRNSMRFWLEVLEHMLRMFNFGGAMAIIAALESRNIERLKAAWAMLEADERRFAASVTQKFAPYNNFRTYRESESVCSAPFVPFMAVHLSDLTFIDEGNATHLTREERRLVNLEKVELMARSIKQALRGQTKLYSFAPLISVQALLVKSKTFDELTMDAISRLYQKPTVDEPKRASSSLIRRASGTHRRAKKAVSEFFGTRKVGSQILTRFLRPRNGDGSLGFTLEDLTAQQLHKFGCMGIEESAEAWKLLIQENELTGSCLYVLEGTLELTRRGKVVGTAGPGCFLNELALILENSLCPVTVTAARDGCTFTRLSSQEFKQIVASEPSIGFRWLSHVARTLSKDVSLCTSMVGEEQLCGYDPRLFLLYPSGLTHSQYSSTTDLTSTFKEVMPHDAERVFVTGHNGHAARIAECSLSLFIISIAFGHVSIVEVPYDQIEALQSRRGLELEIRVHQSSSADVLVARMMFQFQSTADRDTAAKSIEMRMRAQQQRPAVDEFDLQVSFMGDKMILSTPAGQTELVADAVPKELRSYLARTWKGEQEHGVVDDSDGSRRLSTVLCSFEVVEWSVLVGAAQSVAFDTGESIIEAGKEVSSLFLLRSGSCNVMLNGKPVAIVGEGEIFGETSFLAPAGERYVPAVSVVASEPVKCALLSRDLIAILFSRNQRFGCDFAKYLCALLLARIARLLKSSGEVNPRPRRLSSHSDASSSQEDSPLPRIPPELLRNVVVPPPSTNACEEEESSVKYVVGADESH